MAEKFEDLEQNFLSLARNGKDEELIELLKNTSLNVNCKGKSKSTNTWTALHLASYFGHGTTVKLLLDHNADPNITNNTGDSPLHKAALTSREDVVQSLLSFGASPALRNDDGNRASQLSSDQRIKNLLQAAQKVDDLKTTEIFLQYVKEGDLEGVEKMIIGNSVKLRASDSVGNTALHHASMRDQRGVAVFLLQHGADPSVVNKQGEKASDLSTSNQMKKLLDVKPLLNNHKVVQRFEGPLMKRKRILGPKWYWVVLERGVISYFTKRADATTGTKRKMFKYLTESTVTLRPDNQFGFVIKYFDGSHHNLMVHQKNKPLVNRKKWSDAIREHTEYSNHFVVCDRVVEDSGSECEDNISMVDVRNTVKTAQVNNEVLKAEVGELAGIVRRLVDHKKVDLGNEVQRMFAELLGKSHQVLSQSSEVSKALTNCLEVLQAQEQQREVQLCEEKEKNRVLQQAIQALATEHHNLERTLSTQGGSSPHKVAPLASGNMPAPLQDSAALDGSSTLERNNSDSSRASSSGGIISEEDEFYDAVSGDSDSELDFDKASVSSDQRLPGDYEPVSQSEAPSSDSSFSTAEVGSSESSEPPPEGYRESLPVAMFSREEFSIWHILRQCIGKELSKITMPVIFNEPLSFIQRLCEYMEYSSLLQKASCAESSVERMEFVAAFAVSALASQLERLGKPFNPLLGETYEYKRSDLGFCWVSEQVSHHPPVSAFHATGTDSDQFSFWGSVHPKLKFWGKSVEIEPKGTMSLKLHKYNETYTWTNPKCAVHNIVVGKLWMEQHGVMEIVNHRTNEKCVVTFKPYSWFKNDLNKVEAFICNEKKERIRMLEGDWTKYFYSLSTEAYNKFVSTATQGKGQINGKTSKSRSKSVSNEASDNTEDILNSMTSSHDCKRMWKAQSRPANSAKMYSMTSFAMTLNQIKGDSPPPTDSRLRPDIRALEDGSIDGASEEKHRLEEKQRTARKLRHKKKNEWSPRWFVKKQNPITKTQEWFYNNEYTKRDWTNCPDIF